MKTLLLSILVLLGGLSQVAAAQTKTPTPETGEALFQTITVGNLTYTVDSFYAVGCFSNQQDQSLTDEGTVGTFTMQCFFRDENGNMVPQTPFSTAMEGVMAHVALGDALYAYPQTQLEQQ